MKSTVLSFLFISIWSITSAQSGKFTVDLEYSPNFMNTTNKSYDFNNSVSNNFRLAHNVFLKGGYRMANNLFVSGAVGYFATKEFDTYWWDGPEEVLGIETTRIHSYIVAPVGLTYYFGPFYVSPEIGIGVNVSNLANNRFYYSSGSTDDNGYVHEHNFYQVNQMTYPVFLTFGNEIKMKNCSVLLGVKGYYSLNEIGNRPSNAVHYYGFGLVSGVKF